MRLVSGPIVLPLTVVLSLALVPAALAQDEDEGPASLTVCNHGTRALAVAYGTNDLNLAAPKLEVFGWQNVKPGACAAVDHLQVHGLRPAPGAPRIRLPRPAGTDCPGPCRDHSRHWRVDTLVDLHGASLCGGQRTGALTVVQATLPELGAAGCMTPAAATSASGNGHHAGANRSSVRLAAPVDVGRDENTGSCRFTDEPVSKDRRRGERTPRSVTRRYPPPRAVRLRGEVSSQPWTSS